MKHFWWVTYMYKGKVGIGQGATMTSSEKFWFPIMTTEKSLTKQLGYEKVVVMSWKKLSKVQVAEVTGQSNEN